MGGDMKTELNKDVKKLVRAAFRECEGWNVPDLVTYVTGKPFDPLSVEQTAIAFDIEDVLEQGRYVQGRAAHHPNALPDAWYLNRRTEKQMRVY
jgi:hypothetical protein